MDHDDQLHDGTIGVRQNYDNQARREQNEAQRMLDETYNLKSFNNWIKSVLIAKYTKTMCSKIQKSLDIRKGLKNELLHVLDIGCGRGQDIQKWRLARVKYMVANDFSEECIKAYEEKWAKYQPYKLYTTSADFTKFDLYKKIEHSYYDIVSAQLCFHYMFRSKESVRIGLTSILSNLLIEGYFIATIPDSYTIIKKVKERGKRQEDGSIVFGNRYFSLRFKSLEFTEPFGNEYGFYLENAVGSKNETTGEISYTNEFLVPLDELEVLLKDQGVEIIETCNFLDFYKQSNRDEYKSLLMKMTKLKEGEKITEQLWQVAHLYRVLACRKYGKGRTINEFGLGDRCKAVLGKEIVRPKMGEHQKGQQNRYHSNSRGHNRNYSNPRNNY